MKQEQDITGKSLNIKFVMPDGIWYNLHVTNDGEKEKYYCNGVITGEFETKNVNQLGF